MMPLDGGPSSLASAPSYAGSWSRLDPGLHVALQEYVTSSLGFRQMTPVQSSVIPLFLSHKDVIVEAVTGSGKTLAYALPVLQMIMKRDERLKKGQVGALIICPTRELAIQVHGIIDTFLRSQEEQIERSTGEVPRQQAWHGVSGALLAVGGSTSSPADDYKQFKDQGSDIIVGTPGRVEELLKRPGVDLKELEVLILDEADRLLDMGFHQALTSILQMLPKQRRTGLFSATMTDALSELVRVGLRNPVRVVVKVETKTTGSSSTTTSDKRMPATLENCFSVTRAEHKLSQTIRILRREAQRSTDDYPMRKAIVYFATCAQVDYFFKVLTPLKELEGLKLYSLHGKQTPARRRATFDAFVSATPLGKASPTEASSVLLCTDVAARGLDLPNVDLVVQFDPPADPKVFSHRCGRTARAGRRGRAVVMLQRGREEEYADFLKVRKNPVRPYAYLAESDCQPAQEPEELDDGAEKLQKAIRQQIRLDRAVYELSMQAFVSFVQCYRKHEVSFVFRERDLDLGALAFSFGLLRLPKMPEVERWRKANSGPMILHEEAVDLKSFAFADKLREKQRQASFESRQVHQQNGTGDGPPRRKIGRKRAEVEDAWSEQKERKEKKQLRRDKKQRKRAFLVRQRQANGAPVDDDDDDDNKDGKKVNEQHHDDDNLDDWAQEERIAKKARRVQSNLADLTEGQFDDL